MEASRRARTHARTDRDTKVTNASKHNQNIECSDSCTVTRCTTERDRQLLSARVPAATGANEQQMIGRWIPPLFKTSYLRHAIFRMVGNPEVELAGYVIARYLL